MKYYFYVDENFGVELTASTPKSCFNIIDAVPLDFNNYQLGPNQHDVELFIGVFLRDQGEQDGPFSQFLVYLFRTGYIYAFTKEHFRKDLEMLDCLVEPVICLLNNDALYWLEPGKQHECEGRVECFQYSSFFDEATGEAVANISMNLFGVLKDYTTIPTSLMNQLLNFGYTKGNEYKARLEVSSPLKSS